MKDKVILTKPGQKPAQARTGEVPIDGRYEILGGDESHVVLRFENTGNVVAVYYGQVIRDKMKRNASGDDEHWYNVAVALCGYEYPNGKRVVDVLSKSKVILDDGSCVRIDYVGSAEPKKFVHSRPAYLRWRTLMKQPDSVAVEWREFSTFQDWYIANHPNDGRRWALRTVTGAYGPDTCGFDDRMDLASAGERVEGGAVLRHRKVPIV